MIAMDGYDLTITDSMFTLNLSNVNCYIVRNIVVLYIDPFNCAPRENLFKTLIANTNVSLLGHNKKSFNSMVLVSSCW